MILTVQRAQRESCNEKKSRVMQSRPSRFPASMMTATITIVVANRAERTDLLAGSLILFRQGIPPRAWIA